MNLVSLTKILWTFLLHEVLFVKTDVHKLHGNSIKLTYFWSQVQFIIDELVPSTFKKSKDASVVQRCFFLKQISFCSHFFFPQTHNPKNTSELKVKFLTCNLHENKYGHRIWKPITLKNRQMFHFFEEKCFRTTWNSSYAGKALF